jgi:hypothetical protein
LHEKIARRKCQPVLRNKTGILKAVLGVKLAVDNTSLLAKVFRSDQDRIAYFQPYSQVGGVLKLVANVRTQVWHMPAHAQWSKGTQDAAWIDFPTVVGIIKIAVRGEVVVGNHRALLHSTYSDIEKGLVLHFLTVEPTVWSHSMLMQLYGQTALKFDLSSEHLY